MKRAPSFWPVSPSPRRSPPGRRGAPRSALPVLAVVFLPYLAYVAKLGGDNFEW